MAATISDVAHLAGVGVGTVSRVLNNSGYVKAETRELVFAAIKELNYYPNATARNLSINKTSIIGVIVPDITNPFFSDVIRGITAVLSDTRLSLAFFDCNESLERQLQALDEVLRSRVRGLVFSPTNETSAETEERLKLLQAAEIPIVLLDRDYSNLNFDGVFIDNRYGACAATKLLLEEGHRRIAIIHGPMDTMPGRDRLLGYLDAYESLGLTPPEDCRFLGDFRFESGEQLTDRLVMLPDRPTAVFCCNNMMAMGCLKSLSRHGLEIPRDISFIAFDALDKWDLWGRDITFVKRATEEMGSLATNILLKRIADADKGVRDEAPNRVFLKPSLLVRGSEKRVYAHAGK